MSNINHEASVQFSAIELDNLRLLRSRYLEDADRFSGADRNRLRFLRWLVSTGRLEAENPAHVQCPEPVVPGSEPATGETATGETVLESGDVAR